MDDTADTRGLVGIYFSDFFGVDAQAVESYGAFNVSLVNDLPLFIDPFLLFDSDNEKYKSLHDEIIKYLRFLRDASATTLSEADIGQWFHFKEVKQNWLGFSKSGNGGSGLGTKFAKELHQNLHVVFKDFGDESITKSSHLEKVCLFSDGVGRDHLSDFTTNLIKDFLLSYTEKFALEHISPTHCRRLAVPKVRFDYAKKRWSSASFTLPYVRGDFVILTPRDMLTRDAAWINRKDMLDDIGDICEAIPDAHLRSQINHYLASRLTEHPSAEEIKRAAEATIREYPVLIDHFIRMKEESSRDAHKQSGQKVAETQRLFIAQVREFVNEYLVGTDFYKRGSSYEESLERVKYLKYVIEDKDGWRLFYLHGKVVSKEADLQLLYRLTWFATPLDVNREPNNGGGPVDYSVSMGSKDKTLVEFKLAKNTSLRRNLENQVAAYLKANDTESSITVIMHFTDSEENRVRRILKDLKLTADGSIVLIDASPRKSASLL